MKILIRNFQTPVSKDGYKALRQCSIRLMSRLVQTTVRPNWVLTKAQKNQVRATD